MNFKRILLLTCGFFTLIVGTIGVFLPILPTTPFIIVAAACFSGSSDKLTSLLMKNKYLGSYIENYKNKTGISQSIKKQALLFLWVTLTITMVISKNPYLIACLLLVGLAVSVHILMIKKK